MPISSWGGVTSVIDGKLYVLTAGCPECPGTTVGRRLYRYDPRTDSWTRLRDCPNFHLLAVGGAIKGKFYIAGGDQNDDAHSFDKVDVYDPVTNTWAPLTPMPSRRHLAAGGVLGNKLYVIGGTDDSDLFNTVEAYDPLTNKWETKAATPTTRYGAVAGAVKNAAGVLELLTLGGADSGTLGILGTNEAYTR